MLTLGRACLILALAIAPFGIGASLYGVRARRPDWIAAGRRSVYAIFAVTSVAFAVLETAFLRSDFSFSVVASHSSTTTPLFYRATAMWSSQEGSLLLWVWLLSGWSSLILALTRRRLRAVAPYATAVLLGVGGFFLGLSVFMANPFKLLDPKPVEGVGLEPLLRHTSMMIHPPMLYSGYTLSIVPLAFAIGALWTRRLDADWLRAMRRFVGLAWLFLGFGILLGAHWSWTELGWGGYWAWDPVENAALMPWLTSTALLHSMMLQERRGMLKVWNVSLAIGTGILAILGTFLVRSGILQSIHAFGASTLGRPFLVFIAVLLIGSAALVITRLDGLRSEASLDSLLSREAVFLLNNLVLVGMCFVIFWGTFFPLISEAAGGQKLAVGPPWFDRYTVPLAIVLVLLSGIGPVIAWRRATLANARRNLLAPLLVAVAAAAVLAVVPGVATRPKALALFAAGAFVFAAVGQELWRGVRARRAMTGASAPAALVALFGRNRHRYGGYLVHAGIAVLLVGVAASSAFQHLHDVRLAPGGSARIGGYDVRYVGATSNLTSERLALGTILDVRKNGRHVATLRPTRDYYPTPGSGSGGAISRYFDGETESQIGLRSGAGHDLWIAVQPDVGSMQPMVAAIDKRFPHPGPREEALLLAAVAARYEIKPPPAAFRMIVAPLVTWIWFGGLIVVGGAAIALWPSPEQARRRVAALYAGRLGRELRGAQA
ncbi:MAG TPA: heme lyase CcmF/NrfE family subunit [Solirubrobacteraceae bacterium]|nr:heme lyase CcmF/NrfE family subunit [Solirubrobacteraceae bacterium]